jgi:Flp pilus assembly protein TadG
MVEFALIAPVFFLMLFGVMELGRLMYLDHNLANATREGARMAMVNGSRAQTPATDADIVTHVQGKAVGLTGVTVTVSGLGGELGDTVTVSSSADFQFLTNMILGGGGLTLSHTSEVIIQH